MHSVALLAGGWSRAEPLTIAFAETYTALERGTLDAAISGTNPGYGLRWYEVSKYLVGPISMRPHVALAINKNTWKRLPPDIQAILKEEAENTLRARRLRRSKCGTKKGSTGASRRAWSTSRFPLSRPPSRNSCAPRVPEWVKRAGGAEAAKLFNEIIAPGGVYGWLLEPLRRR